jgi:tetrahydromethanopterin S-methyltransferase subunit D
VHLWPMSGASASMAAAATAGRAVMQAAKPAQLDGNCRYTALARVACQCGVAVWSLCVLGVKSLPCMSIAKRYTHTTKAALAYGWRTL